jgi:pantoate--beta-alanine ligase
LALPIEIVPADIVRNADGLALSSRNGYLNDAQRIEAAQLHASLNKLVADARSGRTDWQALEREAREFLVARGWQPDYVAIRRRDNLREPSPGEPLIVLAAARLSGTRLIDNVEI